MKVSFIIPIYKVEQCLRQCVESITVQTYSDIEVILVDDGSPDSSPVLCDALAGEDPRISVIHKENGGLSDARNVGMKFAKGDYVIFVDGDDYWKNPNDLEKLVKAVNNHPECDFVGFNCEYFYPDSNTYTPWVRYDEKLTEVTNNNTAVCTLVKSGTFPMSACLKIIKREFLLDNELYFVKGQIAEDIPWFINVLDKCENCCFVNQYIYAYRQNVSGSITKTANKKSFDSLFDIFKTELAKIDNRTFDLSAKEAIKSFLAYEYSILLTYPNLDRFTLSELFQYRGVLNYTINPKVRMVSKVNRFLGIRVTRLILKVYQSYRRSKS